MAKFNKLDVPHQWRDEFTKYPHGYSIFEALCKWTKQVDEMVVNQNNWNDYLDNFVENFDFELQEEVQSTIERWQSEGLLDDIIESALNTELDNVKTELDDVKTQLADNAYVLKEADNLQVILDSGEKYIALNPHYNYSFNGIALPEGVKIYGNGATITSPDTTAPIFDTNGKHDVLIQDVNFVGATPSPNNQAMVATDIAIEVDTSYRIHIRGCTFTNFLGCGINVHGYPTNVTKIIATKLIRHDISNNQFLRCYMGVVAYGESEYSICSNNTFTFCRVAIWSQSGNWNFTGNSATSCRAAFVSTSAINDIVLSAGDNQQHGNVVGNIFNHCRADQPNVGWATSNYAIASVDYQGVWIDCDTGLIPPNYSGNTQYYTDLTYLNGGESGVINWKISGCVFSACTVSSDTIHRLYLVDCTYRGSVTKTNVVPTGWIEPDNFVNSWGVHSGFTCGYAKFADGTVRLRGLISGGVNNTIAFTLPVGFRPVTSHLQYFAIYTSGGTGQVCIDRNGAVKVVSHTTFVSLDNISFHALSE